MEGNTIKTVNVVGNVEGKNAILIDDLIDTATTITSAAQALADHGAKSVFAGCTHPVFTANAIEKIAASPIQELVVTNTISVPSEKLLDKITMISVAPLLVDAIDRIHNEKAISPLFE